VRAQALHYLARPHRRPATTTVDSPAAWTRDQVEDPARWTVELAPDDIDELEAALARSVDVPLSRLRADAFPLPRLAPRIARWRAQVCHGLGFVRIRGIPVERWSISSIERFYWALGQHFGEPGAQNDRGDLLGHVRDLRLGRDGAIRQYMTREAIGFHCDAADAVGLLCIRPALHGGMSRIASSVAVFNAIVEQRPDLAPLLFERMDFDTRSDGKTETFRARPATFDGQRLRTFYHSEYLRTAARHPGVEPLRPEQVELLDLYDGLAGSDAHCLEMDLRPGDLQVISNHTVVHARTGYTDSDSLAHRRHLLRLWLTLERPASARERLLRSRMLGELLLDLGRNELRRFR
jgi:hypothetical protein